MLLGREFSILSQLPMIYTRHEDGCFRFSIKSFKNNFGDISLTYLSRLSDLNIAKINRELIEIDSIKWILLFLGELNKTLVNIDTKIKFTFKNKDTIDVVYDSKSIMSFVINFSATDTEEKSSSLGNIIHFTEIYLSHENCPYWLDLLNDDSLVEHLYYYALKKFTNFTYSNLKKLDFLAVIDKEYINQIFHIVIPDYFINRGYEIQRTADPEDLQILKKHFHLDNMEVFTIKKSDADINNIHLVKVENLIIYLSMKDHKINFFSNNDFVELESRLLKKVDSFNKILIINKQQTLTLADKSIKNAWFFITLFNSILLYGNTKGIESFKSITSSSYVLYTVSIILLILTILTFSFYTLPSIKLSLFSWKIKKK